MDPSIIQGELALQQWREQMAASRKLAPWWSLEEQMLGKDGSQKTSKEEQVVAQEIDQDNGKFEVIDDC